jgi:hypothetical protein
MIASFMANFVDYDDANGILSYVTAIMDGRASEAADVSADGEWIGVRAAIEDLEYEGGTGSTRSRRPASGRVSAVPTAHSHSRRIEGWGAAGSAGDRPG